MTICELVNAQNPTADFECSVQLFETTTFTCCIRFEDKSFDVNGSVLSQAWDFGDPASGSANHSTGHFPAQCYSTTGMFTVA